MDTDARKRIAKTKKITIWYNQIPNFFWSILSFVPVINFCYQAVDRQWIILFFVLSLLAGFLPDSFFTFIRLGKTRDVYKKIGIRFVKKFTQDGDLINNWIRRKHPDYKMIDKSQSIQRYFKKAYMYEKFHFIVFVFFLLTSLYALSKNYIWWALLLTLINVLYNVYPIFLQQYNRLRLSQLTRKHPAEKNRN